MKYIEQIRDIVGRFNDGVITGAERDELLSIVWGNILVEATKGI